jgi:hypothetical protein
MLCSKSTLTSLALAFTLGAVTVACGDVDEPDTFGGGTVNVPSA